MWHLTNWKKGKSTEQWAHWLEADIRPFPNIFFYITQTFLKSSINQHMSTYTECECWSEESFPYLCTGDPDSTVSAGSLLMEMCPTYKCLGGRRGSLNRAPGEKRGNTHGKYVAESRTILQYRKSNGTPQRTPPPTTSSVEQPGVAGR